MKKHVFLLTILLISVITSSPAFSETAIVNAPGDGFLALRSEPSTKRGIRLDKIPHATPLSLGECITNSSTDNWCKTVYQGQNGWVLDRYVIKSSTTRKNDETASSASHATCPDVFNPECTFQFLRQMDEQDRAFKELSTQCFQQHNKDSCIKLDTLTRKLKDQAKAAERVQPYLDYRSNREAKKTWLHNREMSRDYQDMSGSAARKGNYEDAKRYQEKAEDFDRRNR